LTEPKERSYQIEKKDGILFFRTPNFATERESVLHSGIYNREMASVLTSFAIAGLVYMAVSINSKKVGLLQNGLFLIVFISGFVVLRTLVFKDRYLEAVFDLSSGRVDISLTRIFRRKKESALIGEIRQLVIEKQRSGVLNPDGVEFVEKISAQHGMVIPGFGEERVLFLLKLKFADGSEKVVFSATNMRDAIEAHDTIKEFLGI
jgi:hypothetical protein